MARVDFSAESLEDLEQLTELWFPKKPRWAKQTASLIFEAIRALARHPYLGRQVATNIRELVISRGRTGYVASYSLDETSADIVVLRIRHQRERGL